MKKLINRIICMIKGHKDIHEIPFGCEENERVICLECGRTRSAVIL